MALIERKLVMLNPDENKGTVSEENNKIHSINLLCSVLKLIKFLALVAVLRRLCWDFTLNSWTYSSNRQPKLMGTLYPLFLFQCSL